MIQIDMEMPKRCEWLDDNHNLQSCPLLCGDDSCKLQDCKESWTWKDQYANCPLHEVTDPDTVSRQAEPQTNCEYCHEDSDGYVKPIEKNSHAFVRFGMDGWELSLKANGWHGEARIKFCPMCGRRLADD